jgi:hypothetical protein
MGGRRDGSTCANELVSSSMGPRLAQERRPTKKRQPPAPIPDGPFFLAMFGHVPRNLIQCFRVVAEKPDGSLVLFRGCVGGLLLGKHRQGEASIERQRIDAQARAERFRGIGKLFETPDRAPMIFVRAPVTRIEGDHSLDPGPSRLSVTFRATDAREQQQGVEILGLTGKHSV